MAIRPLLTPFSCRESPRTPIAFRPPSIDFWTFGFRRPVHRTRHWTTVDPPSLSPFLRAARSLCLPSSASSTALSLPDSLILNLAAFRSPPDALGNAASVALVSHVHPLLYTIKPCSQERAPIPSPSHGRLHPVQKENACPSNGEVPACGSQGARHPTGVIGSEKWGEWRTSRRDRVCRVAVGRRPAAVAGSETREWEGDRLWEDVREARCMCRLEERLDEAVPFGIGGCGSDELVSPWA